MTTPTVRELRRRWKPAKERLAEEGRSQATPIRIHRALSWLARVETLETGEDTDFALVSQWIAFNSLYGQWNEQKREPMPDRLSWRGYIDRILSLDTNEYVTQMLIQNKRLVESLLDDEYLSRFFWADPTDQRARMSKKDKHSARTWYLEKRWTMILDSTIERIYLMRCQLVHGAATYGGKLNRIALGRCSMMLGHLVPTALSVMIDHGAEEDWGAMCYPPIRKSSRL
ncbi:MAG: HEPN domain-containing protein [Pirellulales bacterium]